MPNPEIKSGFEFEENKKIERLAVIKDLQRILALSNEMPPLDDDESKSKASPADPNYYNYKVLGTIFGLVRNYLRMIYTRKLLTDSALHNQVKVDEDKINEISSARKGLRDTFQSYGKTGRELRIAMNKEGPQELVDLDDIIKRTINALEQE